MEQASSSISSSDSIASPSSSSTPRPESPSETNRTSRPPPPRIPRPCRCDLFAPPGSISSMSASRGSAQARRNPLAGAGQTNTRSGNQGSGQAPTSRANGQDLVPAHVEDDHVALTDDNEEHAEESVNGASPDSEAVGNGTRAYVIPDTNGSAANSESSDDTSWFKRSCKEVIVPASKGNLTPGDTAGVLANKGLATEIGPDKLHVVFSDQDNIWDGTPQVFAYWFLEGTTKQKAKVREAIDEWTWYANVVFEEATSIQESNIRITFDPNDGSWAYVGKQCETIALNDATMNLAWLDKFSPITQNERATILHEFGHVLGLLHEHQSPAHGGQAIRNVQAAIDLYTKTQGWSVQQVYDQVINVYAMNEVSNFSQVDTASIMHYPQPKELTGLPRDIPYNTKLTDLDKAYMILQYPRKEMHPKAAKDGWNFEKALDIIRAPKDIKAQVLQSFYRNKDPESGEIDPQNSRLIIERWTRSAHLNTGVNGVLNGVPTKLRVAAPLKEHAAIDEPPKRANASQPQEPGAADEGNNSFIKKLYDQLSTLYNPGGGQYFSLQFPTRFLDKQTYAYKLNGYFSRMEKPVVVNEAEFALTDALYDIAPIVGGPNGKTLSRNYEKALNSLIPTFEDKEVRKQREKMRAWLMKTTQAGNAAYTVDTRLSLPGISAETAKELSDSNGLVITPASGELALQDQDSAKRIAQQAISNVRHHNRQWPREMTRMEYSESLMQVYLNERKDWELRKDAKFKAASEAASTDPSKMEALTRELAHTAAIEEAKIAAKYSDAVVRGYTHTVRGFMGHLDIKTTGESLQDAKDAFRQSALSSVYTASSVWPVAMQPADWFESLDTGFTREDLSQDPALIEAALKAKAQLIDTLETQMANLRGFNKGDAATAKQNMIDAAAARESAMAALQQKYTASTISAVKLALEVVAVANPGNAALKTASGAIDFLNKADGSNDEDIKKSKKTVTDLFKDDGAALTDIGTQIDAVSKANTAVNQASRVLTEHMSQYSEAVAGDTKNLVDALQRQVTSAKAELAELQESYTISKRASASASEDKTKSNADVGKLPQNNGGSRWSEVQVSSVVKNDYTTTSSSSSSSVSGYNCNFWLGSSAGSSSSSSAQNSSETNAKTLKVDVAMRTTYVTVDRSGWFDPSLFSISKSFMRGATNDNYSPWSTWPTGNNKPEAATKAIRDNKLEQRPTGYFAAFPVGYVLVKDCVIKISSSEAHTAGFKNHFDEQAESSGGFLCFSHSGGSRSSSDTSSSASTQTQDGIVVRIPGPQILGYIMQLTDPDQSQPFAAMKDVDLFFEDEDDAAKKKASGTAGRANAFNVSAAGASNSFAGPIGIRSYDQENQLPSITAGAPRPANAFNPHINADSTSSSDKAPGQLLDALQTALGDSDVSHWLEGQPSGAKEELWAKLQAAFGKVGN